MERPPRESLAKGVKWALLLVASVASIIAIDFLILNVPGAERYVGETSSPKGAARLTISESPSGFMSGPGYLIFYASRKGDWVHFSRRSLLTGSLVRPECDLLEVSRLFQTISIRWVGEEAVAIGLPDESTVKNRIYEPVKLVLWKRDGCRGISLRVEPVDTSKASAVVRAIPGQRAKLEVDGAISK